MSNGEWNGQWVDWSMVNSCRINAGDEEYMKMRSQMTACNSFTAEPIWRKVFERLLRLSALCQSAACAKAIAVAQALDRLVDYSAFSSAVIKSGHAFNDLHQTVNNVRWTQCTTLQMQISDKKLPNPDRPNE